MLILKDIFHVCRILELKVTKKPCDCEYYSLLHAEAKIVKFHSNFYNFYKILFYFKICSSKIAADRGKTAAKTENSPAG